MRDKFSSWVRHNATLLSCAFAIIIPLFIFLSAALNTSITFDGGMNLQVAQNIVETGHYSRYYEFGSTPGWERFFPEEVQTNGIFIFVASFFMKILGNTQLAFQAANLLFVAILSAAIWFILRRSPIIAMFAPAAILLALPYTFTNSLGGMGEVPAITFVVLSFAVLAFATQQTNQRRASILYLVAMLLFGLAITVKTYMIGYAPALLCGIILFKLVARSKINWKKVFYLTPVAALPIVLAEVYRLFSLGSLGAFKGWWKSQLTHIEKQSGVGEGYGIHRSSDGFYYIDESLEAIANHSGVHLALWLIFFGCLVGLIIAVVYSNRSKLREATSLARKNPFTTVIVSLLIVSACTYLVWWVLLLPPEKLSFSRRAYTFLLPLYILLGLLATSTAWRIRRSLNKFTVISVLKYVSVIIGFVILISASYINLNAQSGNDGSQLASYEETAKELINLPENYTYYGDSWWSSPVISLMSDKELHNLTLVDFCSQPNQDNSFLIWDDTARNITKMSAPDKSKKGIRLLPYKKIGGVYLYKITSDCSSDISSLN